MRRAGADAHEAALDAVVDHLPGKALRQQERRLEIDRHDLVPHRGRSIEQAAERIDAGVADDDVGAAGRGDEAGDRGLVGEVGGDEPHAVGRQRQLARQGVEAGRLAIGQHEARALAGERLAELPSIDAGGPGDDDGLCG